jgi:hypothetical protein
MQNNIIKEDPESYGECQSSSNGRLVAIKQEELPEPFVFVSVKEEVSVGLYHKILLRNLQPRNFYCVTLYKIIL